MIGIYRTYREAVVKCNKFSKFNHILTNLIRYRIYDNKIVKINDVQYICT